MTIQYFGSADLADATAIGVRSADGIGNNSNNPTWGSAQHYLVRVTDASYPGDGSGSTWIAPVQHGSPFLPPNMGVNLGTAAQPRTISTAIQSQSPDEDTRSEIGLNEFSQFFGQFMTHDIVQSSPLRTADPVVFMDGFDIPMGRTQNVLVDGVRAPINQDTSFLDLSVVYGTTADMETYLRAVKTENGATVRSAKLLTGDQDNLLPTYNEVASHNGIDFLEVKGFLNNNPTVLPDEILMNHHVSGDERITQSAQLNSHHTIWMRNHNWHVDQLEETFPTLSQQDLFEAARALNEAEFQSVVYDEYLTKLLGQDALSDFSGYDETVDPSVINEWTTVGWRFGHDQTSNDMSGISADGTESFNFTLTEAFALANAAQVGRTQDNLADWIRGALSRTTQELDGKVVDSVRDTLFSVTNPATGQPLSLDLAALDIHRGRDHGVSDYNALRGGLGLTTYDSFDAYGAANNLSAQQIVDLKAVYGDDISALDSIIGVLLEEKYGQSQLGETATILSVMQFENLRSGDSQFGLTRFADNPELLALIENTSMADILVRTGTLEHSYHDAFAGHTRIGGDDGYDYLKGTDGADLIIGYGGRDKLLGRDGDDDIYGGDDSDWLYGQNGNDNIFGDEGNDRLYGGHGNDELSGGSGRDKLSGGWGDDTLSGGEDRDYLNGGRGGDVLNGGAGNDYLRGGSGSDIFVFEQGSGRDVIADFRYNDRIDLTDYGYQSWEELRGDISHSWFGGTRISLKDSNDEIKFSSFWGPSLNKDDFILDDSAVFDLA